MAIDEDTRHRLERAAYQTYSGIAGDCWGERAPNDDDEYVDVICEMIDVHGRLSRADIKTFHDLSYDERRAICLKVGP